MNGFPTTSTFTPIPTPPVPLTFNDIVARQQIPEIELSREGNPLTAPISCVGLTPRGRALFRFTVVGNAIVTGGAGQLGLAAIRALLEHGAANIAIFDRLRAFLASDYHIQKLKDDFPQAKILTVEVDVTNENEVAQGVEYVKATLWTVDMLLCFAGVGISKHAADVSPEEWREVLDVNITGIWLCAQAVAKHMITQGSGGSIVFVASIAGQKVIYPQVQASYNVSKAGVLHLTRSLAAEWARHGIRVNSISPGYMRTVRYWGGPLGSSMESWNERNPMGRLGEPDELAGAVVLLCSRIGGRYITGEDVAVDGGASIVL